MFVDLSLRRSGSRRGLRAPADHVRAAVAALASNEGTLVRHHEKSWASVTFEGARHTLVFCFTGHRQVAEGEALIAALPEHEFAIPGQLVAEATVAEVEHLTAPEHRLTVTCELLVLKDA